MQQLTNTDKRIKLLKEKIYCLYEYNLQWERDYGNKNIVFSKEISFLNRRLDFYKKIRNYSIKCT